MLGNQLGKSLFLENLQAEEQFSRSLNLILRNILLHCKNRLNRGSKIFRYRKINIEAKKFLILTEF